MSLIFVGILKFPFIIVIILIIINERFKSARPILYANIKMNKSFKYFDRSKTIFD